MSEIKPAMTWQEWEERESYGQGDGPHDWMGFNWNGLIGDKGPHAGAALLLRGQPFGFTWEMVDALDEAVSDIWAAGHEFDVGDDANAATKQRAAMVETIRDLIAALLPPRPSPTE